MRPTSSKDHEEEGPKPVNDTNAAEASFTPSSTTCQPFEILWPRLPSLSRPSARTTASTEIAHKISKKKKEQRWNSAFFYFSLLLTQQIFIQPIKNHLINSTDNFKSGIKLQEDSTTTTEYFSSSFKELNTKMYSYGETEQYNDGSHQLFDPAIGKFQMGQNNFFAPRFRWRNDAELASYAWNRQEKAQVNMMMTENRVPSYGPTTSDKASCGSSCAPRDPSLLDYDAIDVSWRNDIEREKSRPSEYTSRDMYDAQFERDLQVLHEKGYIAPFTTEETNRYEELSKAQFADFYRTVAAPSKSSSFGQSNFLPSSSRLTDYSTAPSTSVFRSFAGDQEESQHSDCHRSDDGYGSNDSGFGSHSEDERNGEDHSNSGEMFYNILEDIPEPQQQHFDNITLAYQPYAPEENVIITQQSSLTTSALVQATTPSDEPSPVLGHYTENGPETLETTLELDEDDYLKYVTNQQVLEDISQSAAEQSFEAADEVLERIQRQHENSDVAVDFTPFDEPLPFLDDDFFLDVDEALIEAVAASNLNGTLSSTSGTSSSLSQSETPSQDYRLYGKLVPEIKFENDENEQDENEYDDGDDINSSDNKNHRRRGRQSKDNDLVKKHELPATAEELAAMSHKALQNLLKDPSLSDTQKSLIKRIRRRGRNKEAARKCRERRIMPSTSSNSGTSSPIKLEPPTTSTSDEKIVHRPFIIYPPTRSTKA